MILYDHTDTFHYPAITGIQRVVRQLGHAIETEAPGTFVPVVRSWGSFYRVPLKSMPRVHPARQFAQRLGSNYLFRIRKWSNQNRLLRQSKAVLWEFLETQNWQTAVVRPQPDDWYLTGDAIWNRPRILTALPLLRASGVRTAVILYDLTPVTHPEWYPPELIEQFARYARTLASFHVVFCISNATKQEFLKFCETCGDTAPETIVTIPLGYEINSSLARSSAMAPTMPSEPFVLCVGTLEPRKNQWALLDAFDILCARGVQLSLIIVGRPGHDSEETVSRIRTHPSFGRRLFYLPNCNDEELETLYARCAFTVLPSLFEGFGLPLIESLARGKPCLCSDLSVFRDSAGVYGAYFNPEDTRSIAAQIEWLYSDPARMAALADAIRAEYSPPRWKNCAREVLAVLCDVHPRS